MSDQNNDVAVDLADSIAPVDKGMAAGALAESAKDRRKRRVELAGAVIIGVAAVLTAIATYLGSQVDGTVQNKSTEAVGLTLRANDLYNEAAAEAAEERDWFFTFLTAEASGDFNTSDVFFRTMPAEVQAVTNEWLMVNEEAFEEPTIPIDDPFFVDENLGPVLESFFGLESTSTTIEGDRVDALADCALFDSRVAEIRGDNYGLSTVFLAIALVVGGIAALLNGKSAQTIVLVTSAVSLVLGATVLGLAGDRAQAREDAAIEFFLAPNGQQLSAEDSLAIADESC
jgi:hypothetical protein